MALTMFVDIIFDLGVQKLFCLPNDIEVVTDLMVCNPDRIYLNGISVWHDGAIPLTTDSRSTFGGNKFAVVLALWNLLALWESMDEGWMVEILRGTPHQVTNIESFIGKRLDGEVTPIRANSYQDLYDKLVGEMGGLYDKARENGLKYPTEAMCERYFIYGRDDVVADIERGRAVVFS